MALVEVIKYNGGPNIFAWKYPSEQIGTWSQLIVAESQEAVLFKGGQALDLFTSGRHTLSTQNIPLLQKLINLPFGGRSPFTAEIWYINRIYSLDIKWGTATPIQLEDPRYHIFLPVRAFGQFGIQVFDSRKFLEKLVGTLPVFNTEYITNYFRGLYLTKVKDIISGYLVKKKISLLAINAYIDELSQQLKANIAPFLAEYGITLVSFYINDISTSEEDSAVKQLKAALSKRAEMDIVGYNYTQERSFDTMETAAGNESGGQGGLMGVGMGLGMGVGIGGPMGAQLGGMAQVLDTATPKKVCSKCQAEIEVNQKFCCHCGADTTIAPPAAKAVCSRCGALLLLGAKFCSDCGTPAAATCPACHAPLTGNPKFCPQCGTSLGEANSN